MRKPKQRATLEDRKFIAWDGEGINLRGAGKPQSYVLFGSSVGHIESKTGLSVFECLDHIIATGLHHGPHSTHVGFAFSYDANMIVQSLSPMSLARLHKFGFVRLRRANGDKFTITFAKGKFFRVTKYRPEYHHKQNPHAKTTVQIFDIFSFFACSFVKAYEQMIGPVSTIIQAGKAARGEFSLDAWDEVVDYWTLEIQLLRELAEELRKRVYHAGLRISQWHGPGALASYAMRDRGIKKHMADTSPEIREASRYAYAGGRFELYKFGRVVGPLFGIDINSAYPYAIAQLPSLSGGDWQHVKTPRRVARFGVYHVIMKRGGGLERPPSPVFHRDKDHNITFPWMSDGWLWSPEAYHAKKAGASIVEGYELADTSVRPFEWIRDMYAQRREWKRQGVSAQIALKLCMNSMYGKLAQRIGWDPVTRRLPPFHQLEWAGWVTSYTRARLFDVMRRIPFDKLIAVETDGLYTTMHPDELGIEHSENLGGWEISEYDEIMYIQSGLAWLHNDKGWHDKRRGLDPCRQNHTPEECDCSSVFSVRACQEYLSTLHAMAARGSHWQSYKGHTTRFLGLGVALQSKLPMSSRHCVWETATREILPGLIGKRVHVSDGCAACDAGLTAYDGAHDLVINSRAVVEPYSYPHTIPWEDEVGHARWRDFQDSLDEVDS
jgi:hypothetical protein